MVRRAVRGVSTLSLAQLLAAVDGVHPSAAADVAVPRRRLMPTSGERCPLAIRRGGDDESAVVLLQKCIPPKFLPKKLPGRSR